MKKLMSLVMALVMALSLSVSVFAADPTPGEMTVTPTMEGYFKTTTVDVTLPTVSLAFTVDPQKLAQSVTSGGRYGDASIDTSATLLFVNTTASSDAVNASVTSYSINGASTGLTIGIPDECKGSLKFDGTDWKYSDTDLGTDAVTVTGATGAVLNDTITVSPYVAAVTGSTSYTGYSNEMKAVNNGLGALNITVTAKVTNVGGSGQAKLVAADTFTDSTTPDIYLALVNAKSSPTTTKVLSSKTDGEKVEASLAANPLTKYNITWDSTNNKYVKTLKAGETESSTTLFLTGKANPNGVWDNVTTLPTVSVVWTAVNPAATPAAPSLSTTTFEYTAGEDLVITFANAAGVAMKSLTYTNSENAQSALTATRYSYDQTTGKLTIKGDYATVIDGQTRNFTFTFDNDASTAIQFTYKPAT